MCRQLPPFVHHRRGPLVDGKDVSPPLKLVPEMGVFVGLGRAAVGNAKGVVSGTMLPDMLVAGAEPAPIVGGKFREKGKDAAFWLPTENDDGVHASTFFNWRVRS